MRVWNLQLSAPMKYLTCLEQDKLSLLDCDEPSPLAGEIVVRLTMCGICGTDTLKVYGAYPKPQKLGHEVVGLVHAVGEGVTKFRKGDRVALAHHVPDHGSHYARRGSETMDPQFKRTNIEPGGFSELIRVPALHVANTVVAIPDHVPDERAVFMEPMACALRALDRMSLMEGDSALVIGVGAIGMLFMPLLRDRAVTAIAADIRGERIEIAKVWGAADGGTDKIEVICKRHSDGRGVDAVILTAVTDATLALALACVRDGGTLMLFGGKPGATLKLHYWDAFLREINFITSYSATPDGLKRAMAILSQLSYAGLESLISHRVTLHNAQDGFENVRSGKASKVIVTP
jgi:L-iditol 2-dehydrogenase